MVGVSTRNFPAPPTGPPGAPVLFFLLVFFFAGHALMDFALQGDAMANCKCRKANHPLQKAVPWYYWMIAHAMLHGAMVGAVVYWAKFDMMTVAAYAMLEALVHWIIDVAKCEGHTNIHHDQFLHIACKVAWAFMLVNGIVMPPAG
jgi:Protein of unknown function (DUF3307)